MKDCKKIHPLLSLYVDRSLTPGEQNRVEAHLKTCAEAREELAKYQRLGEALSAWPEPDLPRDLHEKIMARVTGKALPLPAKRPLWLWPAWGLATAACVALFLMVQNPDLFTFNNPKTLSRLDEQRKSLAVSNSPSIPKAGTLKTESVPVQSYVQNNHNAGSADYSVNETNRDGSWAGEKRASSNLGFAKDGQVQNLKKMKKKSNEAVMALSLPLAKESSIPQATAPYQPFAGNDLAAGTASNNESETPNKTSAYAAYAPAPAMAPPAPNPTEGTITSLSLVKQISASTWMGNNAPATVETTDLLTDAATFQQDWQQLRPNEAVPQVDFTTQAVLFLRAGVEPSAGYSIQVSNLEEKAGQLVVHYQVGTPSAGTVTAQVLTTPWTLQVIPKPSKPVVFQKD